MTAEANGWTRIKLNLGVFGTHNYYWRDSFSQDANMVVVMADPHQFEHVMPQHIGQALCDSAQPIEPRLERQMIEWITKWKAFPKP